MVDTPHADPRIAQLHQRRGGFWICACGAMTRGGRHVATATIEAPPEGKERVVIALAPVNGRPFENPCEKKRRA